MDLTVLNQVKARMIFHINDVVVIIDDDSDVVKVYFKNRVTKKNNLLFTFHQSRKIIFPCWFLQSFPNLDLGLRHISYKGGLGVWRQRQKYCKELWTKVQIHIDGLS